MFTVMSDAEIGRQHVELLPARTVLSMHRTGILGGDNGASGNQGGTGKSPGIHLFDWLTHPGTANSDTAAAGAGATGSADKPS
jgi:hypothetical protein